MSTDRAGPGFHIERFSRAREVVIDVMIPARKKHMIHVPFEADVTEVRQLLKRRQAETRNAPSLTAFLIKCAADAAATDPRLTSRRIGRRKLAVFDDIHVACMVEAEVDGQSHPLSCPIRNANRKTVDEIHGMLRDFTDEDKQTQIDTIRKFARVPRAFRATFVSTFTRNPAFIVSQGFNLLFTSIGKFGAGGGHLIPYTQYSPCIGVGGIATKPGIVGDRIEPREILSITATYDHDITDGAPAARFAQALRELIERQHGLA